jgi:hypothetical protein
VSTIRFGRGGIPLPPPAAAIIFGCVALLFLGMGVKEISGQWDYRANAMSRTGVVQQAVYVHGVGMDITVTLDDSGSNHVVSIVDPNGAASGLRPGQQVTVLYSTDHPTGAMFSSQLSWNRPVLYGLGGFVFLAICISNSVAAIHMFRGWSKRRNKEPRSAPPFNGWALLVRTHHLTCTSTARMSRCSRIGNGVKTVTRRSQRTTSRISLSFNFVGGLCALQ